MYVWVPLYMFKDVIAVCLTFLYWSYIHTYRQIFVSLTHLQLKYSKIWQ